MALRHVATATVLALAGSTLLAGPADARPDMQRRDGHHFPVSVETEVPPGGYSSVATPTLPRDARTVTVKVEPPADASDADERAFKDITHTMAQMSKRKRLLICLEFHALVMTDFDDSAEAQVHEENAVPALLLLGACLQAAGLLSPDPTPREAARAAAPRAAGPRPCARRPFQLPAELEKVDGVYRLEASGTPSEPRRSKLKVTCRVKGKTYSYKVRASKKGTPLRKVVGKRFGIGLRSPADAERAAPAVVTFNTP